MARSQGGELSLDSLSGINYFGPGAANGAQSWSQGEDEEEKKDCESSDSENSEEGGKRKHKVQEKDVKQKNKKTKINQVDEKGKMDLVLVFLSP